jgi:hypothetical protein
MEPCRILVDIVDGFHENTVQAFPCRLLDFLEIRTGPESVEQHLDGSKGKGTFEFNEFGGMGHFPAK